MDAQLTEAQGPEPTPLSLCSAWRCLRSLAFVQVAHVHSVDTDADHCPLCIVLHSTAAPVAAAVLVIVLVRFQAVAPVVAIRPLGLLWRRQLFIRPPPRLSPASF